MNASEININYKCKQKSLARAILKTPLSARDRNAVSMVRMMLNFYHNIAFSNFITSLEINGLHLKEDGSETVKEESQQCIWYDP